MHVISLGMIVPAIRILAILSPTMPPLPSTPIPSPPHSQREQISRPTVLFEVALSKLAQPQTYRVKLCSEATRLCREYAHIHVIQARVLSRPTLVPAVIGYGGREEAFRGGVCELFRKMAPVYHCHATRCSHEKGNHPSPFSSLPCRPTYCEKTSDTEPLLCVFATVACATMTGNCGGINVHVHARPVGK